MASNFRLTQLYFALVSKRNGLFRSFEIERRLRNSFALHPRIPPSSSSSRIYPTSLITGYNFNFPFLSPKVIVDVNSFRVNPLYKHVVSIHHPTLSFLGLCSLVCPFPQFDIQATFVSRILGGTLTLPTGDEMLQDEARELKFR